MKYAVQIHSLSKLFPTEETYSLTDQIRRSSRSVCANIAEAWRTRRFVKNFVSKLCIAECEVAETQVWLEFAVRFAYISRDEGLALYKEYDRLTASLVGMSHHSAEWTDKLKEPTAEYAVMDEYPFEID